MKDEEERRPVTRTPIKTRISFNNYPKWKDKLRERCCKRVREDRNSLLWKLRLPEPNDHSFDEKEFVKSTFQGIVTDELRKIQDTSPDVHFETTASALETGDTLWEYDGLYTAYQGECEEILLEMQRIFYEDPRTTRERGEISGGAWEDEEDEYLAHAVYEHMNLKDEKVHNEVWCPICKQGELQENSRLIYCTLCELKLNRGDEASLDLLRARLAEAHQEHLDRGCRLKPKFSVEARFDLTALYIDCHGCGTFEIVI